MKIERAWLRIIVAVVVGAIAGIALYAGFEVVVSRWVAVVSGEGWFLGMFILSIVLASPIIATVLAHVLTPKERLDGETRCRKCGYILKGLTEPRCSECGERI